MKHAKRFVLGLLFVPLITSTGIALARESSFQSYNFPDRYIRHRDFLMYIERANTSLAINDSAFKVIDGLSGRCHSFEPRNFPRHFIRHQNNRLKIAKFENTNLFRKDASFCVRPGLANPRGISFESVNYPGHFVRHSDYELRIQPNDGSDIFKKDATFFEKTAPVPFGEDSVGIPVPED